MNILEKEINSKSVLRRKMHQTKVNKDKSGRVYYSDLIKELNQLRSDIFNLIAFIGKLSCEKQIDEKIDVLANLLNRYKSNKSAMINLGILDDERSFKLDIETVRRANRGTRHQKTLGNVYGQE
jgi:hypothetical protein